MPRRRFLFFFLAHCLILQNIRRSSQPYSCDAPGPPSPHESMLLERHSQYCCRTNMSRQLEAFQGTFSHFTLELPGLGTVCVSLFLFLLVLSLTVENRTSVSSEKSFWIVRTEFVGTVSMGFYKKTSSYLFTRESRIDCSSLGEYVRWEGLDVLFYTRAK